MISTTPPKKSRAPVDDGREAEPNLEGLARRRI